MAYTASTEKRAEWKKKATENADRAKELILSVSKNYIQNPDTIAEVLSFASNFYQYSINNTELIYAQNPRASFVQSYEGWKKMDAQVLRGETGVKIWVPVKTTFLILGESNYIPLSEATEEQKADYRNGYIEGKTRTTFKLGSVFDIGQTNFPKKRYPELYSVGYSSEQHKTIVDGLINFCKELGCSVETTSLSSISARGYYDQATNSITLNEKLEDTQRLSTLSHEIGHLLQKHGSTEVSLSQKEFEADCISVLTQCHFGIELNDIRKSHLSYHFKNFEAELQKLHPDMKEEDVVKQIEGVLDISMKVFRQFVEQMEQHVKIEIDNAHFIGGDKEKGGMTEEITLYIKYAEPRNINGFQIEKDKITFDNQEEFNKFINGEVAYDTLDNAVCKRDNEILVYADNESGEVIWGTKEDMAQKIEKPALVERYVEISREQQERNIRHAGLSFHYQVNECEEFPTMGETYSKISSAAEAFNIYSNISDDKKSLLGGIRLVGTDSSGNVLDVVPISCGRAIDLSRLNSYPVAKENTEAKKMIKEIVDISKKNGFQTYGSFDFGNGSELEQQNRRHRARR